MSIQVAVRIGLLTLSIANNTAFAPVANSLEADCLAACSAVIGDDGGQPASVPVAALHLAERTAHLF
ncbi:hypothetical protein M0638_20955 [Roseomonas sp. NAR14]|uniref:Secreted protein n=1 Tax=Roseomonas acroporae TaxID=2937791 RepID=A0A9X1YB38_9PROT|nr:hypothetical protein [Roseomonas acroporae]MCK8786846.1 hypothetical protein [Roseomonas acroporae]